jgi:hypothetical protein
MSDSVSQLERQLTLLAPDEAPNALREQVLAEVRRELRASRWDRRLGRVATCVLLLGVGINAVMALGMNDGRHLMRRPATQDSLVQTAVAVARATDVETGRQIARQLAAWSGQVMTDEQVAAFEAALAAELRKGSDG